MSAQNANGRNNVRPVSVNINYWWSRGGSNP